MSGLAHPATLLLVALAGAALYIFVQHGVMWLSRRNERIHLWVALWALSALAYSTARVLQYGAADVSGASVGLRLSLGALILAAVVGVSAVRDLTSEEGHPWITAATLPLHGVMLYLALATETLITGAGDPRTDSFGRLFQWIDFGPAAVLWLPWGLAVLGYCAFLVARAKDLREAERRLLWGGLGACAAAAALDWCQGMGLFRGPLVLDVALVGVAFAFSHLATQRYETIQENLEVEVRRRTHEVTDANQALAMALREAQDSAATKSRFMATLSHEIRTPLNGMLASTQLLMEADLDPGTQRLARIAAKSSRTLQSIVDDVLDLSAVEAGVLTVRPQAMDPLAALEETARMYEDQAGQTGTRLDIDVQRAEIPAIVADPVRVKQVLANLVSNALKYAAGGHIALRVRPVNSPEGPRVRFEVQDDGPGMSPQRKDRVFEPFQKHVHVDTSGSTGLGLAICREMVRRLGGEIDVISREGAGSTFWFELPVGDPGAARATLGQYETDSSAQIPAQFGHSRRVLIAEDNPVNQEVAKLMVKRLGFVCDVVDDGVAAVRKAESGRYAAILMDVRMPGLDGLRATRAIRELAGAAGLVPIVATTANAFEKDRAAATAAGMTSFIPKPIDMRALAATLFELVGAAPAPVVTPRAPRPTPQPTASRPSNRPAPPTAGRMRAAPPPETVTGSNRFVMSRPPPTLAPQDARLGTLRPVKRAKAPSSINEDIEIALGGEDEEPTPAPGPQLMSTFVEDSRGRLSVMSRATASGDAAIVADAAHAIKGAARTVGLGEIGDVCEGLERDAEAGRLPDPTKLNQLIRMIERL